jgi:hypothetical protein
MLRTKLYQIIAGNHLGQTLPHVAGRYRATSSCGRPVHAIITDTPPVWQTA